MAANHIKTSYSNKSATDEFVVDKVEEIENLPTTTRAGTGDLSYMKDKATLGSTAIVGNEGGSVLVYMLFSFGWKQM